MDIYRLLQNKIREARLMAGHTQKEFAQLLGVTQVTVARWETGGRPISLDSLIEVARVTGNELSWFFENQCEQCHHAITSDLLTAFTNLNTDGQERVVEYAQCLRVKYDCKNSS